MNQNGYWKGMMFVGISILLSSFAQLFMRAGMLALHEQNLVLSLPRIVYDFQRDPSFFDLGLWWPYLL